MRIFQYYRLLPGASQEEKPGNSLLSYLKSLDKNSENECIPLFEEVIEAEKNATPGEQVQRAVDGALKDVKQLDESPDLRIKLGYMGSAFMKIMTAKYIVIYHMKGEKKDGDGTTAILDRTYQLIDTKEKWTQDALARSRRGHPISYTAKGACQFCLLG